MSLKATHYYKAMKPCGCSLGAVVDEPGMETDLAESLREFCEVPGVTITRHPASEAIRFVRCADHPYIPPTTTSEEP